MFTGIVSHLGKLKIRKADVFIFEAEKSFCRKIGKGSSVALNGGCLTIVRVDTSSFSVSLMPETLRKTTFGQLERGDLVNLELPLSASGRFDGHLVLGHVDGMATITDIRKEGNSHIFTFRVAKSLSKYIVVKGSIAVNGISLTVIESQDTFFSVGIIPYTWTHTMLFSAKVGDRVNIEVDILAKYLERLIKSYLKRQNVKKTD